MLYHCSLRTPERYTACLLAGEDWVPGVTPAGEITKIHAKIKEEARRWLMPETEAEFQQIQVVKVRPPWHLVNIHF